MTEEWRPIVGYEGLYEVSSYGRVRSVDRYVKTCYGSYRLHKGKIISLELSHSGYYFVDLYKTKRKHFYVHRLVAQAFIENPDNLPEVNHIDEDKINNRADNLEFCDHKYNMNFGTARIRERDTKMKNGWWTGLSKNEYRKKYYKENKDKFRIYYQENKDKVKDNARSYYQKNKDRICEQKKEYRRKKKEENIQNNV